MESLDATAGSVSGLALFLKSLAEEGIAVVSPEPLPKDSANAHSALRQLDEFARNELSLDAPQFSAKAALWAAELFYHFCQFTVCRDIGEEKIVAVCAIPCPEPPGPEVDWSVDLTLRHLPKLFELARHLSNADPLVNQLKQIATAWPLSSVGIPGLRDLKLDSFIGHPALGRIYSDRIVTAADTSRLGDPRVDDWLRADLGIHHELAPAIAGKLFLTTHDTH